MKKLIYTIKDNPKVIVLVNDNVYEVVIYNERPLYTYDAKENGDAMDFTKTKEDKELVVEVLDMFLNTKDIDRIKKHIKHKEKKENGTIK
jgi:hypothetical protein